METTPFINYSTTVSLSPEDNDRFQAVYASQRYGTFFGIFAKFNIQKTGKATILHHIDLELINYKGILNLSLVSAEIDVNAREKNRDIPVILLKVYVMAKIDSVETEQQVILDKPLSIQKGMYFSVISETIPLSGSPKKNAPFVKGLFDDEFHYRDGLFSVPRKVTDINLEQDLPGKMELGFDFQSILIDDRFSSIRCRAGNSMILIPN
jgi:hypothetical protein